MANRSSHRFLSELLAEHIVGLQYDDIPDATVERAKLWILDSIGATLTGAITTQGRRICTLARKLGGAQESTIFHFGGKIALLNAVLANGTLGFALDIDDGHRPSDNHLGGVIIPTAVNVCEREGLSGRELLTAAIIGCDVAGKVGEAATDHHTGAWYSGCNSSFGAAAVAGRLLGLDKDQMIDALGLTGAQGGGMTHGWARPIGHPCCDFVKSLMSGKAAQNGVLAALMAQEGYRGSPSILETYCAVFAEPQPAPLDRCIRGLGEIFEVDRLSYKLSMGLGSMPSIVQAVQSLLEDRPIDPEDVEEIIVGKTMNYYQNTFKDAGFRKNAVFNDPSTPRNCMTSIMYIAAVALMDGEVFIDQFHPQRIDDPKLRALMKKVRIAIDDELTRRASQDLSSVSPAVVTIRTKDNRRYTSPRIYHPKGYDITNPASRKDIEDKFVALTTRAGIIDQHRAKAIMDLVDRIETVENIDTLTELLVG